MNGCCRRHSRPFMATKLYKFISKILLTFSARQYNINHNTKERMARIGISIVQKVSES